MGPFSKRKTWLLMGALILTAFVVAACGGSSKTPADTGGEAKQEAPTPEAPKVKPTLKVGDMQWQTLWINNAIAKFIIEKGYGYPVETVEMTTPIMQQSLVKGDIDLVTEMWAGNIHDWYEKAIKDGSIIDLGPNIEQTRQGWYVPRYMIEGDKARGIEATTPDLKSVMDLPKYKKVLADPENPDKGLLVNCITGWQCAKLNRLKLYSYGLADDFNVQEPGAAAALDAAIAGAYKKGKPFLAYYWEPTWLLGTYDMIMLEEPAFTEPCHEAQQEVLTGKIETKNSPPSAGCGYPMEVVTKAVHPSLKTKAPDVYAFMEKLQVGTQPLNKVAAYMEANKAKAEEAAIWYFENYQETWHKWIPADVATKVEAALKEAGAKL